MSFYRESVFSKVFEREGLKREREVAWEEERIGVGGLQAAVTFCQWHSHREGCSTDQEGLNSMPEV
jgi:hypothetical protein